MTKPRGSQTRWSDAAANAPGAFFELVDPVPEHRWGGGYGWGDEGPNGIEVLQQVEGVEISVWTNFQREPDAQMLKGRAFDIVWREFIEDPAPLTKPHTWTLSPTSRSLKINGLPTDFECLELNTGAWVGTASLNGDGAFSVSVRVHGEIAGDFAIAHCMDMAMSDRPPPV